MKKALILTFGAVVLTALFVRTYRKENRKGDSEKPKPRGYSSPGLGTTVAEPDWGSPFDMAYAGEVAAWLAPRQVQPMDAARAADMAQHLYRAKGSSWFADDDEEAVRTIFQKELRDAVEVATIARKFHWLYQKDLWDYLKSFLSEDELENYVSAPVRLLPPYRLSNP